MKKFLLLGLLVGGNLFAASINYAKYDARTDRLVLGLTYGGCHAETFRLSFGACKESYPAQITATLDDSKDICRAFMQTELSFRLDEMKHCRPAFLTVQNRTRSSVIGVRIP